MIDEKILKDLIEKENECKYLDFKAEEYNREKYSKFLQDIIAMANSCCTDDKFIICGVKDEPTNGKNILGLENITDQSIYQEIVSKNIVPNIKFEYSKFDYEKNGEIKQLGIFRIYDCKEKPYMLKKDYSPLKCGDSWIRIGANNNKITRGDLEFIYKEKYQGKKFEDEKKKEQIEHLKSDYRRLLELQMHIEQSNFIQEKFIKIVKEFLEKVENLQDGKEILTCYYLLMSILDGYVLVEISDNEKINDIKIFDIEMKYKYKLKAFEKYYYNKVIALKSFKKPSMDKNELVVQLSLINENGLRFEKKEIEILETLEKELEEKINKLELN